MIGVFLNHGGIRRKKRIAQCAAAKLWNPKDVRFESKLRGRAREEFSFPGIQNP
jgi:hypothetical protein